MVVKIPKACKNCGHVTDEDKCPLCGGETRSRRRWASMSTGSSPAAFDECANVTLRLPESLRDFLRWPMGPLVHGPDILPTIGRASPVVTVGDFCTLDLVARGRTPDVCVVDFKTKRQEDPELREALQRVG